MIDAPVTGQLSQCVFRILFLVDTLEVGGAEQSLLASVAHLDRGRFEPIVCSVYAGETLKEKFQAAGVRVVPMGIDGKYRFATAIRRVVRLIRRENPDLIHTVLFRAGQVGRIAGAITRTPVVSSFTNVPYDRERFVDNPKLSRFRLACLRLLDALTARFVTRFHSVSEAVRDSNCRHLRVRPEKVTVIPRGRSIAQFVESGAFASDKLKESLGADTAHPVVLNVGRLIPQKGQQYLIRAMPTVLRTYPNAKLLIAGEGRLRDQLEQEIRRLELTGMAAILGRRTDIDALLGIAHVFVFPSLYEGLPGALIEAMLAACPIIASDIVMHRELIEHGETGLLIPPNDPAAVADGILSLANDPTMASRFAESAQRVARQRFDIANVVRETEAFYSGVLGARC